MKISIHMPAYNAEATIGSALRSLLRQRDAGELDIIVVDDGASDRTREVVATLDLPWWYAKNVHLYERRG